jgi:UDP-3-O-[3-hydroxymyristoyl] N-acetylglucosamine deacetylase
VFVRKDIKKKNIIKASWNNVSNTKLCTTISNKFGVTISTIEHLMAAISALQIDNLKIEVSGPELPILDGSSKIYFKKISDIGIVSQEKNKQFIKILKKVSVKNGASEASLSPSKNNFDISYKLNYAHPLIKKEKYSININKNNFKNEIASARTFGFIEEYKKLKKAGLAKGASLNNCIVLNGKKILNKTGLRYKNEFIRHKVLDVIGDLHLSGYSILGHFKGEKSGHKTNNELLKKIFSDKSSFTLVNMNKASKKEINIIALQIPSQIAS